MLAIPSHLPVLLPGNYFQDYLLRYIPRESVEAGQSICRQKEDKSDSCSLAVLKKVCQLS